MTQPIRGHHWMDAEGNPAGGMSQGTGFTISWQNGPLGTGEERRSPNGAFVEEVILAAIDRLEFYQQGLFACPHNTIALQHLAQALHALEERTREREARGVEGTHEA